MSMCYSLWSYSCEWRQKRRRENGRFRPMNSSQSDGNIWRSRGPNGTVSTCTSITNWSAEPWSRSLETRLPGRPIWQPVVKRAERVDQQEEVRGPSWTHSSWAWVTGRSPTHATATWSSMISNIGTATATTCWHSISYREVSGRRAPVLTSLCRLLADYNSCFSRLNFPIKMCTMYSYSNAVHL